MTAPHFKRRETTSRIVIANTDDHLIVADFAEVNDFYSCAKKCFEKRIPYLSFSWTAQVGAWQENSTGRYREKIRQMMGEKPISYYKYNK